MVDDRPDTPKRGSPVKAQAAAIISTADVRSSQVSISSNARVGRKHYIALLKLGLAHAEYDRPQGSNLRYPEMGSASTSPKPPASSPTFARTDP